MKWLFGLRGGSGAAMALLLLSVVSCQSLPSYQQPGQGAMMTAAETEDAPLMAFAQSGTGKPESGRMRAEEAELGEIPDPLEPWNRAIFTFNDRFYFWVFKPFATGYGAVIPEDFRMIIRNAFNNIAMPIRFVNNLLQGKFEGAGLELARFVVNSTAGFGGLVDAASHINLKPHDEDFGQTLGVYGLDHGFYLVWPFLGASSLRDSVGLAADGFLDPVNYLIPGSEYVFAAQAGKYINLQSLRLGEYDDLVKAAVDPYTAVKDAYYQYRRNQVAK
jgi:phospholipid-binding lipoprotein MlaA